MNYIYFNKDKSIRAHNIQNLIATSNAVDVLYIFTDADVSNYVCHIRFKRNDGFIIGDLKCLPVENIPSPIADETKSAFKITLTGDILGIPGPLQITVSYKQIIADTEFTVVQGMLVANVLEAVDLSYEQNALTKSLLDNVTDLAKKIEEVSTKTASDIADIKEKTANDIAEIKDKTEKNEEIISAVDKVVVTIYKKQSSSNDVISYQVDKGTSLNKLDIGTLSKSGYTLAGFAVLGTEAIISTSYVFNVDTSIYAVWIRTITNGIPDILYSSELYSNRYLKCEVVEISTSAKTIQYTLNEGVHSAETTLLTLGVSVDDIVYYDTIDKVFLASLSDESKVIKLTVTFSEMFDGVPSSGVLSTIQVEKNSTVTYPSVSAKTGYTFKGWYRLIDGVVVQYSNTGVATDITLYAYYAKNTIENVTLKFYANNSLVKTLSMPKGMTVGVSDLPQNPTFSGDEGTEVYFAGWYTLSGTRVYANDVVNSNMDLYAKWKKFEEQYGGSTKCIYCNGTGLSGDVCQVCGGNDPDCEHCGGRANEPCTYCEGTGGLPKKELIAVYRLDNETTWR